MGMYTELILGCRLSENTPEVCIKALDAILNSESSDFDLTNQSEDVKDFVMKFDLECMLTCSSYYFGVSSSSGKFWYDEITHSWIISTRSNCKNYQHKIEEFLNYLKPFVACGSGQDDIYAYVLYEENSTPTIYSKN